MSTTTILQYILYSLEFIACITGFIFWKKNSGTFWKWFPVYLGFIFLADQTGNYLNYLNQDTLKLSLINYIVIPIEFLFFYWVYYKAATGQAAKRLVIFCTLVYLTGFISDQLYFSHKEYYFMSFSYSIGNLSLLITIIAFLISFSKSDKIIDFKSDLLFWVSLGLLIFYLATFPYFGLLFLLYDDYKDVYMVYTKIMFICNCLMYILFTTGLIWTKPK